MDKYEYSNKKEKCPNCNKLENLFRSKEGQGNQKEWICLGCFFSK